MIRNYIIAAAILLCGSAAAHEMTPALPKLKSSYAEGVVYTTLKLWNRREDVAYYEITVFDEDWNPVPFASSDKIMQLSYLETKSFEIYVRAVDVERLEYICTTSKFLKDEVTPSSITSRICSRIK